jgi:formyl-CoA transferase
VTGPVHPLDGLRCVEFSERGAGAYAGKLLRRLGAEVVKVETADGDPLRRRGSFRHAADGRHTTAAFDYFNEGKSVVTLTSGAELVDLCAGADACVIDLEPARRAALGVDRELIEKLPVRVVALISPFGESGPYAGYRGPEIVTAGFGGVNVAIGHPGREPLAIPLMQGAVQGGLIAGIALLGHLAGLPGGGADGGAAGQPDRDGGAPAGADAGPAVAEISVTDVWATVHTGTTLVAYLFGNRLRGRYGRRVLGAPYPHQLFECRDGWIAIQASERHQYREFLDMVGRADWYEQRPFGSRRVMNDERADEVDAALAPWFTARTRAEIFAECKRRKIPAAPVQTVSEVRVDPALRERGCLETFTGGTGVPVTAPRPPFRFRNTSLTPPGPVPPREESR